MGRKERQHTRGVLGKITVVDHMKTASYRIYRSLSYTKHFLYAAFTAFEKVEQYDV